MYNTIKNASSLYYWKGEIKHTQQVQMLIKTDSIHQENYCAYLKICILMKLLSC
ncbi:MAG: divalent cation tolerance protein CutA [Candidatus Dasytiphilus stammeri]